MCNCALSARRDSRNRWGLHDDQRAVQVSAQLLAVDIQTTVDGSPMMMLLLLLSELLPLVAANQAVFVLLVKNRA